MAEEGKAKYAAEIWELVRLFTSLGKTIYGLLLLLVGWVFLVKYSREILASRDTVEGLWLPYLAKRWPPAFGWYHPSVSFVSLAGAAFLSVAWLLYSRLVSYAWAFMRHILKPIIFVLAYVAPILLLLLNLVLLPVIIPVTYATRAFRRRRFRANWIARRIKEVPGKTAKELANAWKENLAAMEKAHGEKVVNEVLTKGSWKASYFVLFDTCMGLIGPLLGGMLSRCRVGLAPITPQSYIEEFLASKLPLQVFAQAITRIRDELGELALLDKIQFIELPPSARLHQSSQAGRYAWLFDTDVLLWGTYKASAERVISLNLLSHLSKRKKENDKDEFGSEYQRRFFPNEIRVNFPALSFDQDDEDEVYLVLLVAEILALQSAKARWTEGWRRAISGFEALDRLRLYGRATIQEVLLRVIPPALGRLGRDALPERKPITGRHALVDLTGQWVGSMLHTGIGSAFEELAKRKGKTSTLEQLRSLAEACVRLEPKNAVGHYRVGALRILAKSRKDALQSFRQAGKLEKESFEVHEIGARVAADMSVWDLNTNEDIALAVWAAHAACAINTGDEYAINDVRNMVEKKIPEKLFYSISGEPEPLAITVIKDLLPSPK